MINNEMIPNSSFFFSLGGLDVSEPWQGRWNGGVLVECVGRKEPEPEAIIQGFEPDCFNKIYNNKTPRQSR